MEGDRRAKRASRFVPPPPDRRRAPLSAWGLPSAFGAGGGAGEAAMPGGGGVGGGGGGDEAELDFTVRGTCENLEKKYLRLTSAPDPATVRPERVLVRSFARVCERVERAARRAAAAAAAADAAALALSLIHI